MDGMIKTCSDCKQILPIDLFKIVQKKRYLSNGQTRMASYRIGRCLECDKKNAWKKRGGTYKYGVDKSFLPGEDMSKAEYFFFCELASATSA